MKIFFLNRKCSDLFLFVLTDLRSISKIAKYFPYFSNTRKYAFLRSHDKICNVKRSKKKHIRKLLRLFYDLFRKYEKTSIVTRWTNIVLFTEFPNRIHDRRSRNNMFVKLSIDDLYRCRWILDTEIHLVFFLSWAHK